MVVSLCKNGDLNFFDPLLSYQVSNGKYTYYVYCEVYGQTNRSIAKNLERPVC